MQTIYEAYTPEETARLGESLGKKASPGDIYILEGELGAGKTIFTKGLAAGLGIAEEVNSPTFTIVQIYEDGRLPLYHFDAYRIADAEEMEEVGYEDYFYGGGVSVVEWGSRIAALLPGRRIDVRIEKDAQKGFDYRKIIIAEA